MASWTGIACVGVTVGDKTRKEANGQTTRPPTWKNVQLTLTPRDRLNLTVLHVIISIYDKSGDKTNTTCAHTRPPWCDSGPVIRRQPFGYVPESCETWVPRSKNSFSNRKKSKILRKSHNYYLMVGFIVRPLLELAFWGGWNWWFMIIIIQFKSGSTSSVSVFMSRCRHWSKSSSFITMMTEEHINVDTTPLMKLEI